MAVGVAQGSGEDGVVNTCWARRLFGGNALLSPVCCSISVHVWLLVGVCLDY